MQKRKIEEQEVAPPPDDLNGWRHAVDSDRLSRLRIECVVEAVQSLKDTSDRRVINALMTHISDVMVYWLRRFVGKNHRNEGVDVIESVQGKMIEAVLQPTSPDGIGLRTTFYKRLQFRATDALQDELLAAGRFPSFDDPSSAVSGEDGGVTSQFMQQNADISRLLDCITDPRKRRAFCLHMEGCPLAPGKATVSIAGELGVSAKTAGEWIDEVVALLKAKIGDRND